MQEHPTSTQAFGRFLLVRAGILRCWDLCNLKIPTSALLQILKGKARGGYAIGAKLFLAFGIVGCSPEELTGEREFHDVSVVGLAPGPDSNQESIVQVYAARSYEWPSRIVSVHTWLAFRQKGQEKYIVYEAHRFRPHLTGRALRTCRKDYPDRRWHGADPTLLFEIRGALADQAIPAILDAVAAYEDTYRLWPGPNSNSLVAALAREVAQLRVDLPPTAIGKDFIPGGRILARAPSGTGWQVSLGGLSACWSPQRRGSRSISSGWCLGWISIRPRSSSRWSVGWGSRREDGRTPLMSRSFGIYLRKNAATRGRT